MSFNDNRQFWTEFIELYREHRALWDVKSKQYSNKHIRKEGYDVLVEKCKEIYPESDEKFVKTKIEILRGSFRREMKKVLGSKKTGSGQEEIYQPTLWYYNLMEFINDQETVRKGVSSIRKRPRSVDPDPDENGEIVDNDLTQLPPSEMIQIRNDDDAEVSDINNVPSVSTGCSSSASRQSAPSTPVPTATPRNSRKKKTDFDKKQEQFLDLATVALSNQNKFRAFGNNVAFQLEDMERNQQVVAEKLIAEVLFHGKLGNLTANASIQINQPPPRSFQLSTSHNDTRTATHQYPYRSNESESILLDQYPQRHSQFNPRYQQNENNVYEYSSQYRSKDFVQSSSSATIGTDENPGTAEEEIREYLLLGNPTVKK